ncbi:MAG: hypothetical protein CSA63_00775 [Propionibacterium sp.]|nr:MAG: hypothetical protein CSA63_00775 [Propionibacterium sp.]
MGSFFASFRGKTVTEYHEPGPENTEQTPANNIPPNATIPIPQAPPKKRIRSWPWTILAFIFWTLAVGLIGLIGGWFLASASAPAAEAPQVEIVEVPKVDTQENAVMPDLRGLKLVDAKQLLADAGFDPNVVSTTDVQWAGEPGTVIAQDPVGGETVGDSVSLQVSVKTVMPDVVGKSEFEATSKLAELGVTPEINEIFNLEKRTGTVLESTPKSGEPLSEQVTLTVAKPGGSLYLSQLEQVDRNCSSSDARLNGKVYQNSLECQGQKEEPATGFWLLDRHAMVLTGTVGVDDRGDATATGKITFIGDGKPLGSYDVSYAKPKEVSLNVENVLRLEIHVTTPNREEVVLADFLLKGAKDQIALLEVS